MTLSLVGPGPIIHNESLAMLYGQMQNAGTGGRLVGNG